MKLNLGCGNDILKGYVNLDIVPADGVDVVHNLSKLPLPFEDNTFDYVLCNAVLEHLPNFIYVMEDLYRVCRAGAVIDIDVPHFSGELAYRDPTHVKFFHTRTFDSWDINNKSRYKTDLGIKMRFDVQVAKIYFFGTSRYDRLTQPLNKIISGLINLSPRIYERFFCWVLPSNSVKYKLRVVKQSSHQPASRQR